MTRKQSEGNFDIPAKWVRMIACLLTEKNHRAAAKKARVPVSTLADWLNDPRFQAEYRKAKAQLIEKAVGRLPAVCEDTVDKLWDIITNPDTSTGHRLTAIRTALEFVRTASAAELEERIGELEAAIEQQLGGDA